MVGASVRAPGKPRFTRWNREVAQLGRSAANRRTGRLCASHRTCFRYISYVAYELNRRYWRQGTGSSAVTAMLEELSSTYAVHTFVAILKTANYRSMAFLRRLGFSPASRPRAAEFRPETDESVMIKTVHASPNAA